MHRRRHELLAQLTAEKIQFTKIDNENVNVNVKNSSRSVSSHYWYILPLIKDVHLLELKCKEVQKEYDEKRSNVESAYIGQSFLRDCLEEDECILKRWYTELQEHAQDEIKPSTSESAHEVTNIMYSASFDGKYLHESLGFTILCNGVHLAIKLKSSMPCSNIHFISPSSAELIVSSDTAVPGLEEKVVASIKQRDSVMCVLLLVAKYIKEDMAPFVIVIPMKKKKKKRKEPLPNVQDSTNSETISVENSDEKPKSNLTAAEHIKSY